MDKSNFMILNRRSFKTLKRMLDHSTSPLMKRGLLQVWSGLIDAAVRYRGVTGWDGLLPNFVIIGTQKGGTTYLYDELIRHPRVLPALIKEVTYFDLNFHKGLDWYKGFFPCHPEEANGFITGEASPDYMFHPNVPRRLAQTLPNVKLIVLLRNPVKRAYSHYHHEVRLGFESLQFDQVITCEEERTSGEKEKMVSNDDYYSHRYMHFSYRKRGIYTEQLQTWFNYFPREQILILRSEDFYSDTPRVMHKVYEFLGLAGSAEEKLGRPRIAKYPPIPELVRDNLRQSFVSHNEELSELLGQDFRWST